MIEPESISLSVWSPPYFVGKEYEQYLSYKDWTELLDYTIRAHFEVLKPGGFLVVNIADILCFPDPSLPRFQALNTRLQKVSVTREDILAVMHDHPNHTRKQIASLLECSEQTIDRRLNGNNIRGGKHQAMTRVHLAGEIIERATRDSGMYLYDRRIWRKDPAWQNSRWHRASYRSIDEFEYLYFIWKPGEMAVKRDRLSDQEWKQWGSRAVWEIPSVRSNSDHEAKFPVALPARVIRLLTDPGELVLDCFMGSGSTAVAAIQLKRRFIGIELLEKYVAVSERSIETALKSAAQLHLL